MPNHLKLVTILKMKHYLNHMVKLNEKSKFKVTKYQTTQKRGTYGAFASLVNVLSVAIPLEFKNIIDQLQNGFSSDFVIKSLWLIL